MKTFLPSGVFSFLFLLPFVSAPASAQSLAIVSGNGQLICSSCPTRAFTFDPLVVVVKDARGTPLPNATVTWTVNNPRGSDGRVVAASTVTGADGTTSNTLFLSAPIMLLQTYLQTSVVATAFGSSVTFTETNGSVAIGTGLAQILTSLQSPIPGTLLTGPAGSISSIPVRINVASLSAGGPVPGVEVKAVSDPNFPAGASCVSGSVMTDAAGNAQCNLQFGNTEGQGRIRIHVGGNYDVYGPFTIQVTPGTGPSAPGGPPASTLTANPFSLTFQYPGPVTQNVAVIAASGSVTYTAAVQVTIARVDWLTVGSPTGPAGTDGRSTFPVTLLPQSLPPGTFHASIAIHPSGGGQDLIVQVQAIVSSNPGGPSSPPNPTGASLTANPSTLTFQYPGPVTQNVAVVASGGTVSYTPAVQVTIARVDWLTVGSPTGPAATDGRSTFPVSILPQSLTPGTYRGTITIHPVSGGQDVFLNVQLIVSSAFVSLSPGALRLSQVAGHAPFSGGAVNITSSGAPVPFTASVSGANWFSISPTSGITPAQIVVSVNAGGLAPGSYAGSIDINAPGAANSLLSLSVNLSVDPSQSLRLSTSSLVFSSDAGAPAPPSQTIAASASDGTLSFSAAANVISPPGGNWLQVSPASGAAGGVAANLVVSVNPAGLDPGSYAAIITLTSPNANNSPQAVNVSYVIAALPAPLPATIASAASGILGPVAPGEIITIMGRNLGPAPGIPTVTSSGFVQTLISETQVTFDNLEAPLLYVSATQINAIVPYAVAGRASTRMVVSYRRAASAALTLTVADAVPEIFVIDASGQGAIVNADGTVNGPATPAAIGSVVVMFATGGGATVPFGTDGKITPADVTQLTKPVLPVTVTIGGRPAEVQYAGAAPGMVSGALQVNVVIPDDAPTGAAVPVALTVGSIQSQGTAVMAIQ